MITTRAFPLALPPQDVETCDLLIVDRAVDPVAPIVHDWSYEALIHDLLPLEARRGFMVSSHLPLTRHSRPLPYT